MCGCAPLSASLLSLDGPAGPLEARLDAPAAVSGIALLCHPHPLYGGSMHDGVLAAATEVLQDCGFACLRFNFRGVGGSAGHHDDGRGEVEDALAASACLRDRYPGLPLTLLGYSFGARIAWASAAGSGADRLLLVAPPVAMMDFSGPAPAGSAVGVIVGSEDPYAPAPAVEGWAHGLVPPAPVHVLPGIDHFFQDGQALLARALRALLP